MASKQSSAKPPKSINLISATSKMENAKRPSSAKPPKSINLINVDKKSNKLKLNQEAVEFLRQQNEPFGVLVCLGPYRMGKSYLLNRIVDKKDVFGVGHTDRGETKGVMMYNDFIRIENSNNPEYDLNYLVLDTEGIQSDDNSEEVDTKLFLISFLLSSLLIYNTKSSLNRETFNQLDIITNLSEKVKVRRRTDDDDRPDLIWIIRDYSLQSTKRPNERVQDFLEVEKFEFDSDAGKQWNEKRAERVNQRNKVREAMIGSFHSFDCHYFPVPVSDNTAGMSFEKAMQSLNRLYIDDLRPEFNREVDRLKKSIEEKMRPKTVGGKSFQDGRSYIDFIQQCIDKINTDSSILDSDFELFWINKKMEKMQDDYQKMLNEKKTEADNLTSTIDKLKDSNKNLEDKLKAIEKELNEKKNQIAANSSVPNQKQQQAVQNSPLPSVNPTTSSQPNLYQSASGPYQPVPIIHNIFHPPYSPPSPPLSTNGENSKYHPINISHNSTTPPSNKPTSNTSDEVVGIFISNGKANGREVYQGPRGGLYYLTDNGNKKFVQPDQVIFF